MYRSAFLPLLIAILGLQACTNSPEKAEKGINALTKNDSTTIIKNGDSAFLANVARRNLEEIVISELALKNSSNERVKGFASMVKTDHRIIKKQLAQMAAFRNIAFPQTPDEKYQQHIDRLTNRKGPAFDLSYMKMMVKDHRGNVKQFRNAVNDAADPNVQSFARATLPVMQKHLDSAKAIYNKLKPPLDNVIVP